MKMFVGPAVVYLHRNFIDFRKTINGLAVPVEDELNRDAYTWALLVFCNKAKDKLKILYWDKTAFALWQKPLEKKSSNGRARATTLNFH
jgi:transposase